MLFLFSYWKNFLFYNIFVYNFYIKFIIDTNKYIKLFYHFFYHISFLFQFWAIQTLVPSMIFILYALNSYFSLENSLRYQHLIKLDWKLCFCGSHLLLYNYICFQLMKMINHFNTSFSFHPFPFIFTILFFYYWH